MNNNNGYGENKPYKVSTENISSVDNTIFVTDEMVMESLPVGAQSEVVGLDSFGRMYRSPGGGSGDRKSVV